MPITKSAKKSLRTSIAKRRQNDKVRRTLEINLKNVSAANLSKTISLLDKAVKNHVLHKNKVNRMKSRLSKKYAGKATAKAAPAAAKVPAKKPAAKAKKATTTKAKK